MQDRCKDLLGAFVHLFLHLICHCLMVEGLTILCAMFFTSLEQSRRVQLGWLNLGLRVQGSGISNHAEKSCSGCCTRVLSEGMIGRHEMKVGADIP